jgi:hypothetical protein
MPVIGYDVVLRCARCNETLPVRIADGPRIDQAISGAQFIHRVVELGWEINDDGDYVCFQHRPGGKPSAPTTPSKVRVRNR